MWSVAPTRCRVLTSRHRPIHLPEGAKTTARVSGQVLEHETARTVQDCQAVGTARPIGHAAAGPAGDLLIGRCHLGGPALRRVTVRAQEMTMPRWNQDFRMRASRASRGLVTLPEETWTRQPSRIRASIRPGSCSSSGFAPGGRERSEPPSVAGVSPFAKGPHRAGAASPPAGIVCGPPG